MADKYLELNSITGKPTTKSFTTTSTGVADAGKGIALNSAGELDITLLPSGVGPTVVVAPASEALLAGNYVNVWNDAGTAKGRKTDASAAGKEATGFVLTAVEAGQNATIYTDGTNNALTGLTPGERYFLSATTPGGVTTALALATGNVVQYIGTAVSETKLPFQPQDGYVIG